MLQQAHTAEPHQIRRRDMLQARLVASHVLVILVALGLVLLSSAFLVRRYERTVERERLTQLAVPLMAEVNIVRLGSASAPVRNQLKIDAIDAQADAMNVRILILDVDGTVRYDTEENANLRKQEIPEYADIAAGVVARAQEDSELHYEFVEPPRRETFGGDRLLIAAGQTGIWKAKRALVIVTDSRRYPLLGLFLPRLFLITGVSLLLASALGLIFSRRIAEPVRRLTTAANAMAAGHLEQTVPAAGVDEIGQLVGSFNSMSRQVAATYRSQRELLADVAHELRTPLTSVQGYAQALREGVIDDPGARDRALDTIGRESGRMSTLIGQLLDLARLESGQSTLTLRPVSAADVIARVGERFRPLSLEKDVAFTATTPPELTILGDEGRLVQIFSNLVANAIRHTPELGLISITACAIDSMPGGVAGVRIIVHDTGEGISEERLPHIFDRFARGEQRESEEAQGFGLGLAIVRELVNLHHGSIAVHSQLGRGTTFTVDLPSPPSRHF